MWGFHPSSLIDVAEHKDMVLGSIKISTRSGRPKAVNHDAEVTKDTMPPANNGSTEDVQTFTVVQSHSRNPNPEARNGAPVVHYPIPKASNPFSIKKK
ncbi:hypothetical protein Tco_0242209 [Tanacetum coccineum]